MFRPFGGLMEAEPGFWQRDWSDATLAKGIETAGDLALVWEDDTTIAGFVCAHDLGFRAYLSELIVAQGATRTLQRTADETSRRALRKRGLYIHPNIWHEGVFGFSGTQRFFDKQGAVHARVSVDSGGEAE